MPILRDESEVEDGRLDRLTQFDERSRAYGIRHLVETKKPRGYTWRCDAWLDQGTEGACVGFSMAHELAARPAVVLGMSNQFAREQVYWEAQRTDQWSGGAYPGARPRYEGTSVLAGVKVLQSLGFIREYRWAFGLQDLILAVGHGGPAVLGVNWYSGMYDPDHDGMLRPTGDLVGGHAILCHGVSVSGRFFKVHNSWGRSWGLNGEALVSWNDMERLLHEGGEACIPSVRVRNP